MERNEWDRDHELKCRLGIRGQSLSLYFRRPLTNHISSKVGRARIAPYRPLIEMQPARKQLLGVDHELNIGTYLLAGVFHRWRKFSRFEWFFWPRAKFAHVFILCVGFVGRRQHLFVSVSLFPLWQLIIIHKHIHTFFSLFRFCFIPFVCFATSGNYLGTRSLISFCFCFQ